MSDELKRLKGRLDDLERDRMNFSTHWQEIATWMLPEREFTIKLSPGVRRRDRIFDATAAESLERLSASIMGMLVNPGIPWFSMAAADPVLQSDPVMKDYLDRLTAAVMAIFKQPKSCFYTSVHEVVTDSAGFGTGVLTMLSATGGMKYRARPLGACYIAEGSGEVVDTLFYKFKMRGRDILAQYGDKLDIIQRGNIEKKSNDMLELVQAIEPNEDQLPNNPFSRAFVSTVFMLEPGAILSKQGFDRQPFAAPRYTRNPGENYGRGPGMKSLPDVKMLNQLGKSVLYGIEMAITPPVTVPDSGYVLPLQLDPRGVNFEKTNHRIRGGEIKPIFTGANPNFGQAEIERRQANVRRTFLEDILSLPELDRQTATEASIRQDDRLQMASPVINRHVIELLDPVIDATADRAIELGMVEAPPEELSRIGRDIHYVGPMALAQRAGTVNPIRRLLQDIIPVAQVDPSVLDNFDFNAISRLLATALNVPGKTIRPVDQVDQMRQQRAEQEQMQAQAAAARDAAAAGADVAGAIKDLR